MAVHSGGLVQSGLDRQSSGHLRPRPAEEEKPVTFLLFCVSEVIPMH